MVASIWVYDEFNLDSCLYNASGSVIQQTDFAGGRYDGLGRDSDGSLWTSVDSSYFQFNLANTQTSAIAGPGTGLVGGGLNLDGSIWLTDSRATAYKVNKTGSTIISFSIPDGFDTAVESNKSVLIVGFPSVTKYNEAGSATNLGEVPCFSTGLGITSEGSLWLNRANESIVYKTDQSINTQTSFTGTGDLDGVTTTDEPLQPTAQPASIWTVDAGDNTAYKLDLSGTVITSFSTGSPDNGIAHDLDGCLWIGGLNDMVEFDQTGSQTDVFSGDTFSYDGAGADSDNSIWSTDGSESIYQHQQNGTLVTKFSTGQDAEGAALESNGSIWTAEDVTDEIYRVNQSGSIDTSFVYTEEPTGVGIDTDECVWVADNTDTIVQLDRSGIQISSRQHPGTGLQGVTTEDEPLQQQAPSQLAPFQSVVFYGNEGTNQVLGNSFNTNPVSTITAPGSSVRGVGHDENSCLWITQRSNNALVRTDQTGSLVSSFSTPNTAPNGTGIDNDGSVWHVDAGQPGSLGVIFRFNKAGSQLASFATPGSGGQGTAHDTNDCIWHNNFADTTVYELNRSGNVQTSFAGPFAAGLIGPGIRSNGSLWHGDFGNSGSLLAETNQTGSLIQSFGVNAQPIGVGTTDEPIGAAAAPSLGAVLKTSSAVLTADSNAVIQTQQ